MVKNLSIQTNKRFELIDITPQVEKKIGQSEIKNGLVYIFVPHSTAAIILTENEKRLKRDWLEFLKKQVLGFDFEHNLIDNNADSHLLSGLLGQGKVIPIENGQPIRGTWQEIFLVELDGPRERRVVVKIVGS
jgi:secondary thiamine-phosphate synthase enzyme